MTQPSSPASDPFGASFFAALAGPHGHAMRWGLVVLTFPLIFKRWVFALRNGRILFPGASLWYRFVCHARYNEQILHAVGILFRDRIDLTKRVVMTGDTKRRILECARAGALFTGIHSPMAQLCSFACFRVIYEETGIKPVLLARQGGRSSMTSWVWSQFEQVCEIIYLKDLRQARRAIADHRVVTIANDIKAWDVDKRRASLAFAPRPYDVVDSPYRLATKANVPIVAMAYQRMGDDILFEIHRSEIADLKTADDYGAWLSAIYRPWFTQHPEATSMHYNRYFLNKDTGLKEVAQAFGWQSLPPPYDA